MKFRPRFSLRTLFLLTTLAACTTALLVWRYSTLKWIQKRHEALTWEIFNHGSTARGKQPDSSNLPLNLRIWGESVSMKYIYFCIIHMNEQDQQELAELKRLFPEAKVAAKTEADWDRLEARMYH